MKKISPINITRLNNTILESEFHPESFQKLAKIFKEGYAENAYFVEAYRKKLEIPEKKMSDALLKSHVKNSKVPDILGNILTETLVQDLSDNLYHALHFNNHKAVSQLIYIFQNGLQPNPRIAVKYEKKFSYSKWKKILTKKTGDSKMIRLLPTEKEIFIKQLCQAAVENLAEYRKEKNFTYKKLSEEAGFSSVPYLFQILKRKRLPSLRFILKLEKNLNKILLPSENPKRKPGEMIEFN